MMNLHRTRKAQWADVSDAQRNMWQRLAARSHSILTPANAVSVAGGLMVMYGLYAIANDSLGIGIIAIACGRIADILDGYIAEYTATKSPLGEALDATIDKLVLASTLVVLLFIGSLPLAAGVIMAGHGVYNSIIAVAAWLQKIRLQPSRYGKYATGIEWGAVAFFLLVEFTAPSTAPHSIAQLAAWSSFVVYLMTAIYSSAAYSQEYVQRLSK
jgi:cardiolipin synthase (CMP-forming)